MTESETLLDRIPPPGVAVGGEQSDGVVSMVVETGSIDGSDSAFIPNDTISSEMEVTGDNIKIECKEETLESTETPIVNDSSQKDEHKSSSMEQVGENSAEIITSNRDEGRYKCTESPNHENITDTNYNSNDNAVKIEILPQSTIQTSEVETRDEGIKLNIPNDYSSNQDSILVNISDTVVETEGDSTEKIYEETVQEEEKSHPGSETHSVHESETDSVHESVTHTVHESECHSVQEETQTVFQSVTQPTLPPLDPHPTAATTLVAQQVVNNSPLITTPAQMTVLTADQSVQTFSSQTLSVPSNNMLKTVVENTIDTDLSTMPLPMAVTRKTTVKVERGLQHRQHHHQLSPHDGGGGVVIPRPPQTDILLQTAREVLQLPEEPGDVKNFTEEELANQLTLNVMPVVGETVISTAAETILSSNAVMSVNGGHRISMEDDNIQQMEVSDENATYILEPVTNEEYYQDDQNIMWIQETVEVEQESYDNLPNMVIILNPNGTVNEELMLAHGMNLETIKAVTDNVISVGGLQAAELEQQDSSMPNLSIKSLQHPIPRKELHDVKPLFANTQVPRTVMESMLTDSKPMISSNGILGHRTIVESNIPVTEHSRSVILDAKDNFLVLDDELRDPMIESIDLQSLAQSQQQATHRIININGTQTLVPALPGMVPRDLVKQRVGGPFHQQHQQIVSTHSQLGHPNIDGLHKEQDSVQIFMGGQPPPVTSSLPMTPLGTLDLSLPKKPDPSVLDQLVNPAALVSENSVLKAFQALSNPLTSSIKDVLTGKVVRTTGQKVRRPKARDENGNGTPYIHRKTTSLGALGQALHGIPRDSRENAVQICPICKWQATTKNPYRHLQDHLARVHFKDRIAADLPTKKPYICPMPGCDGKHYPDWQAVMRHYIGKKHGILDKFVKEELSQIRRENGGRIPGTIIKPGVELHGI